MSLIRRTAIVVLALGLTGVAFLAPKADAAPAPLEQSGLGIVGANGVVAAPNGHVYVTSGYGSTGSGAIFDMIPAGNGTFTRNLAVGAGDLDNPVGLAMNPAGHLFVTDPSSGRVVEYAPPAETGFTWDKVNTLTNFTTPMGIAFDADGDMFVADAGTDDITEIPAGGSPTVIQSGLDDPTEIFVRGNGEVWVTEVGSTDDVITLTPSGGSYTKSVFQTDLSTPDGVAVDSTGRVFVSERSRSQVTMWKPAATPGIYVRTSIDAHLEDPRAIALGANGTVYVASHGSNGNVVAFGPNDLVRTGPTSPFTASILAGNGETGTPVAGTAIAGPLGAAAYYVARDAVGNLYLAAGNRVLKLTPSGTSYTTSVIAGDGSNGSPTDGPALDSPISATGVAVDAAGNVYVTGQGSGYVEKLTPSGGAYTLATIAGNGTEGASTNGPALATSVYGTRLAVDKAGNVYVGGADMSSGAGYVTKLTPSGADYNLRVIAGTATWTGVVAGPALSSSIAPLDLAVNAAGQVFVADQLGYVEVLKPAAGGTYTLSVIAGNPDAQDIVPGPAINSMIEPIGIALDSLGDVVVADQGGYIVGLAPTGSTYTLSIVAGNGGGHSGDDFVAGPANKVAISPIGVLVTPTGDVLVANVSNYNNVIINNYLLKLKASAFSITKATSYIGTGRVGAPLKATVTMTPAATQVTYQWLRNGVAIAGATKATYVPVPLDLGKKIALKATYQRLGYVPTTQTSSGRAVLPGVFAITKATSFTGVPRVGSVLTVRVTIAPSPIRKYQWLRNGAPIRGATRMTYRLAPIDLGKNIRVRAMYQHVAYLSRVQLSAPALIKPALFTIARKPSVSGLRVVGKTLVTHPGLLRPLPMKIRYQWVRNGRVIANATRPSYVLTRADRHARIVVRIHYTRPLFAPLNELVVASKRIP